ncbi:TOTE conflict system archaeo-eukaryotic primase domain-containing protein [Paraburkholderia heleia]|uniref:TOTE conflict system archaeo-eukaryotic primase domain-containing protein n=1 Tax=Paraburkholderia heleia TaxID=634127 RepID=UPI0038BA3672
MRTWLAITVGLYPLMPDGTCYLLAVDFDEESWRDDVMAFRQSRDELDVPVSLEISRSGKDREAVRGGHEVFVPERAPGGSGFRLALPCARRLGAGLELPLQRSDLLGERVAIAP